MCVRFSVLLAAVAILIVSYASCAEAGAWLPKKGAYKSISKYNIYEYEYAPLAITYDANDSEIYFEYGIDKNHAISLKYLQNQGEVNDIELNDVNLFEMTIRRSLPIKNGLLPPFTETLLRKLLKLIKVETKLHREKPSAISLHFLHNSENNTNGYGASLAFGDKISLGSWYIFQEAEYRELRFNEARWQGALYKAQIGYGSLSVGQELDYFHDRTNDYRSLTHFYYVSYEVPRLPMTLRFGKGDHRFGFAPAFLPGFAITARGDYTRFEVEYKF